MESPGPDRTTTPPPRRKALLLLNPKARSGSANIDGALERLSEGGIDAEEAPCREAADIGRSIRDRCGELDLAIVGGGDGTLNCAARAILDTQLPLGILPLGTANDLARTLGVPLDPLGAAGIIVDGHERRIDIGEVNGHLFFNVASIGFSAQLAEELTAEAKKRFGKLGYLLTSIRLLLRTRRFTAFLEHDDSIDKVKTVQVSIGNGRHYGGGLTVHADAEPDDGSLHVYSLEVDHWWKLMKIAPHLRKGTQGDLSDVRVFATRSVTIRTRRARSVNTDGELTTATPAAFRVIPKAIRILAPERR